MKKPALIYLFLIGYFIISYPTIAQKLPPPIVSEVELTNELRSLKSKKYQQHRLYGKKLNVVNPSSYIGDHSIIWNEFQGFEKQMQDGLAKKKTIEFKGENKIYFGGLEAYYLEYEGIKDNEEIWGLFYFAPDMVGSDYYDNYPPKKMYEIKIEVNGKYAHLTRLDTEGYTPNGKYNMAGWENINGKKIALVETYSQAGKTTKYLQHQNENTAEIKINFNEGEKEIDIAFNRKTGAGKYRHPDVEEGKWLCWNAEMRDVDCGKFNSITDFENVFETEKPETAEAPANKNETDTNNSERRVITNQRLGYSVSIPNSPSIGFYPLNDGITGRFRLSSTKMQEGEEWTAIRIFANGIKFMNLIIYMIEEKEIYTHEQIKSGVMKYNTLKNAKLVNEEKDYELAGIKGSLFELEQENGESKMFIFQYLNGTNRVSIQYQATKQFDNLDKYDIAKEYVKNIQIKKT